MAYIYSITLFVDTWLSVLTRIALPLLFKRTIICDRCVYDTLVDLAISVRNPVFKNLALRVFANMMPKGKVIMLKASVETLRKRRDDLLEDEDLELKVLLYEMLASKLNLIVLDSERTIKEVHEKIMGIYSINNTAIS
jgi:thymidylate kinase